MASASSIPTNALRSKRPRPLAPDGLHRHLAIFGRELVDVLSSFTRRGKARPELTPPSRMPTDVPYSCHDGRRTTVIGSHSKAFEMATDLGTSRSAPTVK
jgi:predicted LPLAT superfamily acyltransferase